MKKIKLFTILATLLSCCTFAQAEASPHSRCYMTAEYQEPVMVQYRRPCYRPVRVPIYQRPPERVVVIQEPCYVEEIYVEERCHCCCHSYTTYRRPVYRQPSIGFSFSWLFR